MIKSSLILATLATLVSSTALAQSVPYVPFNFRAEVFRDTAEGRCLEKVAELPLTYIDTNPVDKLPRYLGTVCLHGPDLSNWLSIWNYRAEPNGHFVAKVFKIDCTRGRYKYKFRAIGYTEVEINASVYVPWDAGVWRPWEANVISYAARGICARYGLLPGQTPCP